MDDAEEWVKKQVSAQGKTFGASRPNVQHPKGMEPGIRIDTATGRGHVVAVVSPGQDPKWEEVLKRLGFGDVCHVLDVVEVRAWEVFSNEHGKQVLNYVKAKVRVRNEVQEQLDVDELCQHIQGWQFRTPKSVTRDPLALLICLSDWQVGKSAGDGVKGTVAMVQKLVGQIRDHFEKLVAQGYNIQRLVFACMGDMIEGCDGHYAMQAFEVELDRRQQCKVTRRLMLMIIKGVADLVPEIVFVAVPGNHGEHRKDGKAFTTWGDNDDLAVVEQMAEICAAHSDLSHVSFVVPKNELTLTLDICGIPVAFAHGHQARTSSPEKRLIDWWRNMALAQHPVGGCRILITGHYHHLVMKQIGHKTWFQCPPLDGGSPWWEHRGGAPSVAGTLTMLVGESLVGDWDHVRVFS